jgi:CRP-like cAMP-binding protein
MVSFQKDLHANPELDPIQGMIGFGEIALLYNDKRTASITALTDCETWVLTGECFKFIIAQNSIRRRNISLDFLNKVELFNELEQYEKIKLIDGLTTQVKLQGDFIFHEGDRGDHFYIIEEGEVEFGHEDENGKINEQVRVLGSGSHFGEIALINGVKRTLSVRVVSERAKLLLLGRDTFGRILGSIKDFLKEDYKKANGLDDSFASTGSKNPKEVKGQQTLFNIKEEDEEGLTQSRLDK